LPKLCPAALLILAILPVSLLAAGDAVVLHVIGPEEGFTDLDLYAKLGHIISGLRGLELLWDEKVDSWISEDHRAVKLNYSKDLQRELADRFNARYLVWVKVLEAGTFTKSGTLLPFLFKSHKRKFLLEVELRIIDSKRDGMILSKRFKEVHNGSRALAYLDLDETNEPALMASYPEIMRCFDRLEKRMAARIADELLRVTRHR